ncbi:MAG: VWA domain-containing protein [Acidobacteria bacterium]|nr:VWA domain-containing protein [Acidobacteriota bacterium]
MVPVTATDDYNRFVGGMQKEDFTIYDDEIEQEIAFFSHEDIPATIGIIFDLSSSMSRGQRMDQARAALKQFIDTSHPDDEFFLIGFNQRVELLQDFTSSAKEILNSLEMKIPDGFTALYDACYLALEKVTHGRYKRQALLIISDGMDNKSRYAYRQLEEMARERDVLIYAIGGGGFGYPNIKEISSMTGGQAFPFGAAFEAASRIALELRHQYSLGFYPTSVALDGQWHRLRVKVNPPPGFRRLHVRAREGYYAAKK